MAGVSECEVCGNREARFIASIQGARLSVCGECAKSGKILQDLRSYSQSQASKPKMQAERELAGDYAEKIRRAREKLGVPLKVLAERIFEKESYLDRIEKGATLPSEAAARKLEKELGIRLFEEAASAGMQPGKAAASPSQGTTLGDLVVIKDKKKKG